METLEQKIEKKLKELSDFSDAKVGDKVYSLRYGEQLIVYIISNAKYPIQTNNCSYTINGKHYTDDLYPILFKSNPFIEIAKLNNKESKNNEERWIEVYDNKLYIWIRRKLVAVRNNKAICWSRATNDEEVLNATDVYSWDKWREIQPEVELTLEQIAEKFGIDVNKLKIKK